MDNKIHHNHPVIKRIYLYIFLITYLVFLTVLIFFYLQSKSQQANPESPQQLATGNITAQKKTEGSLALVANGAGPYKVGQPITLYAVADSEGKDIVSFDVLLGYDKTAFSLVSVSSPLPGFQIIRPKNPAEDHLSMTVIKSLQVQTPSIFTNTKVLQFVFSPKKIGAYNLSILQKSGKEKTDFADTKTHILYPKTENLLISVY